MLKIACHGGRCCGVKTIHGFESRPDGQTEDWRGNPITHDWDEDDPEDYGFEPALEAKPSDGSYIAILNLNPDSHGREVSSEDNFFYESAPIETPKQRLDRYLEFLKKVRPKGIVEVCLIDKTPGKADYANQVKIWGPIIRKRGFKKVTSAMNSNSGNVVSIFHKVMGE